MHRNITVRVAPEKTDPIIDALKTNKNVIGLSVHRNSSVVPPGDVIEIHVLNRGADRVLKLIEQTCGNGAFVIVTSELASIISPKENKLINNDVDEAIWEEIETGLRHNGKITPNFLLLMAIGGITAAVGFVSDVQNQVIAFVAASIISPALEPLAKIPLGLVLRKKDCLWFGLRSTFFGYAILLLAAVGTFYFLIQTGEADPEAFIEDGFTQSLMSLHPKDWLMSITAATASIVMYLSYRRNVIAGPLIALILIPALCATGISMLIGRWEVAGVIAKRLGAEILVTVIIGALFIWLKQRFVHKRTPIV